MGVRIPSGVQRFFDVLVFWEGRLVWSMPLVIRMYSQNTYVVQVLSRCGGSNPSLPTKTSSYADGYTTVLWKYRLAGSNPAYSTVLVKDIGSERVPYQIVTLDHAGSIPV